MNEETERIVVGIGTILLAVGIGGALLWKNFIYPWLLTMDWYNLSKIFAITLLSLIILLFAIKSLRKKWQDAKYQKGKKESDLKEARKVLEDKLKTHFYGSSGEIEEELQEVKKIIKSLPKQVKEESKQEINEFYKKTGKLIDLLIEKELEQRREVEAEKRANDLERRQFNKQVEELFVFKKSKKSVEALPLHKKYSDEAVREARSKMKDFLRKEKQLLETRKQAMEYYSKNDLDTKPDIDEETEEIFLQVRQETLDGKLSRRNTKNSVFEDIEPLPKPFYRAKEMNENMKKRALALGYQHVRGLELDGNICGGGFYIKPAMEKETPKHFMQKHLFAELHPKMKVEWGKDGKRTDVAYISKKVKVAIEIETGTNNNKQLAAKTKWLKKHFDYWIIVCSRNDVKKYNKWADKKRSFCLTSKAAKKKVKSLIK